jgi:thiamine pyrophosphokinase
MSIFSLAKKGTFALIILNNSIPIISNGIIERIWKSAKIRVCADGGANRLFDYNPDLIPNYLIGDFDSVKQDKLEYYHSKQSAIVQDSSVENADAEKCIEYIKLNVPTVTRCFIYGFAGGVLDKELNCYHLMAKWFKKMPLVLVDENDWATMLPAGDSEVEIDTRFDGPRCGLVPLFCEVQDISTEGLVWNLNHSKLKMGEFICTSNRFAFQGVGRVKVSSSGNILFTCQIKERSS